VGVRRFSTTEPLCTGLQRDNPLVLSASTGALLGNFTSQAIPAFDGSLEFTETHGTLAAVQTSTGQELWSQTADGTLDSAPIVVGGKVYAAGSSGLLASFNEDTGAESWSTNIGSPFVVSQEQNLQTLTV
jgi:outer membrane protein assembly factor BamB